MNNTAIGLISNAMDTINAEQVAIYHNPHYNYRHDSAEDTIHFLNSDIGKALTIMNKAWCDLFDLRESLKAQDSYKVVSTN